MNINRYNYEEFFLLYVDNELTKEERAEVESFVQDNPDLEEELVMLKQSSLKPDMNITFTGKSSLMKAEAAGLVNETNYEEFFLLYVDNELETIHRREVEQFAADKPQYQQELNLLLQARVEPETAVMFPDKSLLYKEESDERKPVVIMWWRVTAIAAMLLVALGIFWINSQNTIKPADVAVKKNQKDQPAVTKKAPQTINNIEDHDDKVEPTKQEAVNNQQLAGNETINKKNDVTPEKNDGTVAPNLALNTEHPDEETLTTPKTADVAAVDNTKLINIVDVDKANRTNTVQVVGKSYAMVDNLEENENSIGPASVDRKNKMRGLFRKVARVFEKTTNLPAVEERGILIGNLEIALK